MIKTFRDQRTRDLFNRCFVRQLAAIERQARRRLEMLNAAATLGDLSAIPANHLHKLGGDRGGQHAIRINDKWRVCFVWSDGDAYDVEITDYH